MPTLCTLALGLLAFLSDGNGQALWTDPGILVEVELLEFGRCIESLFEPILPSPGGFFEPCRVRNIEAEYAQADTPKSQLASANRLWKSASLCGFVPITDDGVNREFETSSAPL